MIQYSKPYWCHERLKPKKWNGESDITQIECKQEKKNGHRHTFFKQPNGRLVCFGRNIREDLELSTKYPQVMDAPWWEFIRDVLPENCSLDGELYLPGQKPSAVKTALVNTPEDLHFGVFAVPFIDGIDSSLLSVREALTNWFRWGGKSGLPWNVEIVWGHRFNPTTETEESLKALALEEFYEGWVLKVFNYSGWYKVKPVRELDVIVTGFAAADPFSKYAGMVGALKVSAYIDGQLTELANVSGMDDETRAAINKQTDLGRVCEVSYQDIGSKGRLIHAHFTRWRDGEKSQDECKYTADDL